MRSLRFRAAGPLPPRRRCRRAGHRRHRRSASSRTTRRADRQDLRRQAAGLADLYAGQARVSTRERGAALRGPALEQATGASLYYVGSRSFPGQASGLRALTHGAGGPGRAARAATADLEFTPPGAGPDLTSRSPSPIELGGETFGALVVAKPKAELGDRWLVLVWRVGLAFLGGLARRGRAVRYLSRRLTQPVLALSARRRRGRAGPLRRRAARASRRATRSAHLADRFREMTRTPRGGRASSSATS